MTVARVDQQASPRDNLQRILARLRRLRERLPDANRVREPFAAAAQSAD
jgi:hypothetical protein